MNRYLKINQKDDHPETLLDIAERITNSAPYTALEAAVVVGLLSAVDGGFSGDWSRFTASDFLDLLSYCHKHQSDLD